MLRAERAITPARPGPPGHRAWCAVARWPSRAARRRGTVPCTHAACCSSLLAWLRCGGGRWCGRRWRAAACSTPAWCATTAAGTAAGRRSLARVWPSQLSAGSSARGLQAAEGCAWPVPVPVQPETSFRITQQACTCASKYNKARQAPPAQPPALWCRERCQTFREPSSASFGPWRLELSPSTLQPRRVCSPAAAAWRSGLSPPACGPWPPTPPPGSWAPTHGRWVAVCRGPRRNWGALGSIEPSPPALQIASSAFSGNSAVAEFSTAAEMTEEPETTGWGQVSGLGWGGHPCCPLC